MLKSSEYFCFKSNWACDYDPGALVTSSLIHRIEEWNGEDSADLLPNDNSSTVITFTRDSKEDSFLELKCWCTPHLNVKIHGLDIVSEARTIECYSDVDGYLKSCRGNKLQVPQCDADGTDKVTQFHCSIKLDDAVDDLAIKFLSSGSSPEIHVRRLDFKIVQSDSNNSLASHGAGMVDMAKVKSYLHSMGDNLPAHAAHMLESVEHFQKTQMASLSQLSSPSILSNLLAMVTTSQTIPPNASRTGTNPAANSSKGEGFSETARINDVSGEELSTTRNLQSPVNDTAAAPMSPLQAMLRQMTQGQTSDQDHYLPGSNQADGDGGQMFKMLQNICGRVSEIRVKEQQASTADPEDDSNDQPAESTQKASEHVIQGPDRNNVAHAAHISMEKLQEVVEVTVTQIVSSSEDKIRQYIDTSLNALELRLCNKMEEMMKKLLQKDEVESS